MYQRKEMEKWIIEKGYTKEFLARKLGITACGFTYKMNNGSFSMADYAEFCRLGMGKRELNKIYKEDK